MPSREAYSVGWICGLVPELVAAEASFDEEHENESFAVTRHDNNTYTCGKIGHHNVVIACIADGDYGTVSAATVARDMLHTFPNIRIGLFVGIGSGAPNEKDDIRLGDVVVSKNFGIHEYKSDEAIRNKTFSATKWLNTSPLFLRTAVTQLKKDFEKRENEIESSIEEYLGENKRLRKKYERPAPQTDRLYESDAVHPKDNQGTCEQICDEEKLIGREERDAGDRVQIFEGNIASANTVIRDAILRDNFSKSNKILCFETEAAGLMNHYPCLIIRGICDYADSHANDKWHGYAAMTASAYARQLLLKVPVDELEKQRTAAETVKIASASAINSTIQADVAAVATSTQNASQGNLPAAGRRSAPKDVNHQNLQAPVQISQDAMEENSPQVNHNFMPENTTSQDGQAHPDEPPPAYSEKPDKESRNNNKAVSDSPTSSNAGMAKLKGIPKTNESFPGTQHTNQDIS